MNTTSTSHDYVATIADKLPELATSADLVDFGLFGSEVAISKARKNGSSPDWLQISPNKILYPRAAVLKFLRERIRKCSDATKAGGEVKNAGRIVQ